MPVAVLGIYSTAANLSNIAAMLVGNLANRVLVPLYSKLMIQGGPDLRREIGKYRLALMAATLPIPAAFYGFGPIIIGILVGPEFRDAGWMLQLLAGAATLDAIQATIWPVLLSSGDSFRYMIQAIIRTILLTASLAIGFYVGDLGGLIYGLAVGHLLGYPVLVVAMRRTGTWLPLLDLAAVLYALACGWALFHLAQWVEPWLRPLYSS